MDGTRLREELVALVSELASRPVALTEDLISAGVDSLGVMSVVSWLADEVRVEVTLDELLACATLEEVARLASAAGTSREGPPDGGATRV